MDLDAKRLGRKPRPKLGSLRIEIGKILTCFIDGHYNISCYNYIAQYWMELELLATRSQRFNTVNTYLLKFHFNYNVL